MLLATVVVVALAWQTSVVTQPISEISGTVDQIDRAGRLVTIRSTDGLQTPIYAGPDLPAFINSSAAIAWPSASTIPTSSR